jgi:hypothetical protein
MPLEFEGRNGLEALQDENMTRKERAKLLGQQLQKAALRSRTGLIEATIRDAENDIMARISDRLESELDPLSPPALRPLCAN